MKAFGSIRRCWDLWRARRDGKRDGLRGVPTQSEVASPPALQQLRQRADEALASLWRSWESEDARLREAAETAERQLELAQTHARAAAETLDRVRARHEAAREHLTALDARVAPDAGIPRLSQRVYRVAIVAILLAEFPLNAVAFRLFGEAEVLTWVMTASLAVTLVLCAHGLGTFLRAPNQTMAERRWIAVLTALPFLTIVGVALIRARYLSEVAEATGLATLGPVLGSLVFLVINLLVYVGASMLSYLAHGPRAASRKLESEAVDTSSRELREAEERLAQAQAEVRRQAEAAARGPLAVERALRVGRARASERRSYHAQLMSAYCSANIRARGNPEIPSVLCELPEIAVPAALRERDGSAEELASRNGHLERAEERLEAR